MTFIRLKGSETSDIKEIVANIDKVAAIATMNDNMFEKYYIKINFEGGDEFAMTFRTDAERQEVFENICNGLQKGESWKNYKSISSEI